MLRACDYRSRWRPEISGPNEAGRLLRPRAPTGPASAKDAPSPTRAGALPPQGALSPAPRAADGRERHGAPTKARPRKIARAPTPKPDGMVSVHCPFGPLWAKRNNLRCFGARIPRGSAALEGSTTTFTDRDAITGSDAASIRNSDTACSFLSLNAVARIKVHHVKGRVGGLARKTCEVSSAAREPCGRTIGISDFDFKKFT